MYLKRYRGETNCQITMLLDASASMGYTSHGVTKLDYARYLAASLAYLANQQRDAAGLIVFDGRCRQLRRALHAAGPVHRIVYAIEKAELGARTDLTKPLIHFQEFLHRRGLGVVISDFWQDADEIVNAIAPLRFHGNEMVLFHILDPQEIQPKLNEPVLLVDMETQDALEVSPEYAKHEYRQKIDAHIDALRSKSKANGLDYFLLPHRPPSGRGAARISDRPPREVVAVWVSSLPGFWRASRRWACRSGFICCANIAARRIRSAP